MRSRWERRKEDDVGQVAKEDETFVGFDVHGKVVSENCNSGDGHSHPARVPAGRTNRLIIHTVLYIDFSGVCFF